MPMTVARIDTLDNMHTNVRATLLRAGLPEYLPKEEQAGFKVWHADRREGETLVHWHTYTEGDVSAGEMRAGLEKCAVRLQQNYWVKLDAPGSYTDVNRLTLRVLFGLTWLA